MATGGAGSLVRQPRQGGAKEGSRTPARRPLGIPRDADKGIPLLQVSDEYHPFDDLV